jgi:hypothetical protein
LCNERKLDTAILQLRRLSLNQKILKFYNEIF